MLLSRHESCRRHQRHKPTRKFISLKELIMQYYTTCQASSKPTAVYLHTVSCSTICYARVCTNTPNLLEKLVCPQPRNDDWPVQELSNADGIEKDERVSHHCIHNLLHLALRDIVPEAIPAPAATSRNGMLVGVILVDHIQGQNGSTTVMETTHINLPSSHIH